MPIVDYAHFVVPADFQFVPGDCLFDAVGYLACRASHSLRQAAMDEFEMHIQRHTTTAAEHVHLLQQDGEAIQHYIARMRRRRQWADEHAIVFLANALRSTITCWHHQTGRLLSTLTPDPAAATLPMHTVATPGRVYNLAYNPMIHYEPIPSLSTYSVDEPVQQITVSDSSDDENVAMPKSAMLVDVTDAETQQVDDTSTIARAAAATETVQHHVVEVPPHAGVAPAATHNVGNSSVAATIHNAWLATQHHHMPQRLDACTDIVHKSLPQVSKDSIIQRIRTVWPQQAPARAMSTLTKQTLHVEDNAVLYRVCREALCLMSDTAFDAWFATFKTHRGLAASAAHLVCTTLPGPDTDLTAAVRRAWQRATYYHTQAKKFQMCKDIVRTALPDAAEEDILGTIRANFLQAVSRVTKTMLSTLQCYAADSTSVADLRAQCRQFLCLMPDAVFAAWFDDFAQHAACMNTDVPDNKDSHDMTDAQQAYNIALQDTPTHECSCCGMLCFSHQLHTYGPAADEPILQLLPQLKDGGAVCQRCYGPLSQFREDNPRPPVLGLLQKEWLFGHRRCYKRIDRMTDFEATIVCPYLVFANISIQHFGPDKLHKSLIYVLSNLDQVQRALLPRLPSDSSTLVVELKRRMNMQHPYRSETVRPNLINSVMANLICNPQRCPVYADMQLQIDPTWREEWHPVTTIDAMDTANCNAESDSDVSDCEHTYVGTHPAPISTVQDDPSSDDDTFYEQDPAYTIDSMIDNEIRDKNKLLGMNTITIAPGEGNRPIGFWADQHGEEKAFLQVYHGQPRPAIAYSLLAEHKLTLRELFEWELRHISGRVRHCSANIFYKEKKLLISGICNAVWFHFRKTTRPDHARLSKHDVETDEQLRDVLTSDTGYTDMSKLRGSVEHLKNVRLQMFASIRQEEPHILWITWSAADTHWHELLQAMHELNLPQGAPVTDVGDLPPTRAAELLRRESLIATLYTEHRFRAVIKLLQRDCTILGAVANYLFFTQFQQRTSAHVHGLLFMQDGPVYGKDDAAAICKYIDGIITCDRTMLPPDIPYNTQLHYHQGCMRKGQRVICRLGMPGYPMLATTILEPLKGKLSAADKQKYSAIYERILTALKALGMGQDVPTTDWIRLKVDCTYDEYITAIRAHLTKPMVALRRTPRDVRISPFNRTLLGLHRANMNVQFCLTPHAAAQYITSYVTRPDSAVTRQLEALTHQVQQRQISQVQYYTSLGNLMLNASQIGIPECIYHICSLDLQHFSRQVVYIDINRAPIRRLKPKAERDALSEEDKYNIWMDTIRERYANRCPDDGHLCLADFACMKPGQPKRSWRVLRCKHFSSEQSEDYQFEHLLLFAPWHNSPEDFISRFGSWHAAYQHCLPDIERNKSTYFPASSKDFVTYVQSQCVKEAACDATEQRPPPRAAPATEEDAYNIAADIHTYVPQYPAHQLVTTAPEDQFRMHMRSCNRHQRSLADHFAQMLRLHPDQQILLFVFGRAGTGKTWLCKLLREIYTRHKMQEAGLNMQLPLTLTYAFTGTAAGTAGGNTIHSTFPTNWREAKTQQTTLSRSTLNTLQCHFCQVGLFYLSEVSLCTSQLFWLTDKYWRDITGNYNQPFGGLHGLVDGDLFQVRPVGGTWVFQPPSNINRLNALAPNIWHDFGMFELAINERCKQPDWTQAIHRLGGGEGTEQDIALVNQRVVQEADVPKACIHRTYFHNTAVDDYNTRFLQNLPTPTLSFAAVDDRTHLPSKWQISDDHKKTSNLKTVLELRVGVPVEVSVNLDVPDLLSHGVVGCFRGVAHENGVKYPTHLWVDFPDAAVGARMRQHCKHLYQQHPGVPSSYTPIPRVSRQVNPSSNLDVYFIRHQFPILLAAARTGIRTQSSTLDMLACDPTTGNRVIHGYAYSAITRTTTKEGLFLLKPVTLKMFVPERAVVEEVARLRADAALQLCVPAFTDTHAAKELYVVTHNIRSLDAHIADITCVNNTFWHAHVIHMAETRSMHTLHNILRTHVIVAATDETQGAVMCVPTGLQHLLYQGSDMSFALPAVGTVLSCMLRWQHLNLAVFGVYRSPRANVSQTCNLLQHIIATAARYAPDHVVVLGDFNADLLNPLDAMLSVLQQQLTMPLQLAACQQQPSTDAGTCLDHVYTTWPTASCVAGTLNAYISDHYPAYITLQAIERPVHSSEL